MIGAALTTFILGMRHGVDVDHVAAITDIAGSQPNARSSMRSATLYAVGHGAVVFVLGSAAVLFGGVLPDGVDLVMGKVVGATLLLLAAWILVALVRDGRDFRMRSRWTMLFGALARRTAARRSGDTVTIEHEHRHEHGETHDHGHDHAHDDAHDHAHDHDRRDGTADASPAVDVHTSHRHRHVHVGTLPADPFVAYTARTSVAVGVLHGIGAETATQVLVFLAAVEAGGFVAGEFVLLAFVLGLIASNTAIAAVSTIGFRGASASFPLYAGIAVLTACFSIVTGVQYLFGG